MLIQEPLDRLDNTGRILLVRPVAGIGKRDDGGPGQEQLPPRKVMRLESVLLRVLGAEVSLVHSGRAALQAVQSFRPEVVLLDIGMPGMDGYEVARRIRANNRSIMLIALTGWGQEEDRQRSAAAGFNHHLVKPADIEQSRQLLSVA